LCENDAVKRLLMAIRIAAWLLLTVLLAGIMFRTFERNQVFHPYREMEAQATELGRPFEDVTITTSDGLQLHGWFFPCATNSIRAREVVLYCHGNGGNISHRLGACGALLETGVNVLLFDYRGYGRSEGRPTEEGTYLDGQAAYRWLKQRGFAPPHILAFGESLGGAVAVELALRERLCGIVLQSSFTSIPDVGADLFPWLPVRWLATIQYDSRAKLGKVKVPVMVMHSRLDRLVGFHHAQANYASAKEPKLLWELAGDHNDSLSDRQKFVDGMEKFLALIESTDRDNALPPGSP
jgi:fermentation-respiration switch protein FrsA (DUF1100 family)